MTKTLEQIHEEILDNEFVKNSIDAVVKANQENVLKATPINDLVKLANNGSKAALKELQSRGVTEYMYRNI